MVGLQILIRSMIFDEWARRYFVRCYLTYNLAHSDLSEADQFLYCRLYQRFLLFLHTSNVTNRLDRSSSVFKRLARLITPACIMYPTYHDCGEKRSSALASSAVFLSLWSLAELYYFSPSARFVSSSASCVQQLVIFTVFRLFIILLAGADRENEWSKSLSIIFCAF